MRLSREFISLCDFVKFKVGGVHVPFKVYLFLIASLNVKIAIILPCCSNLKGNALYLMKKKIKMGFHLNFFQCQ